MLFKPGSLPQQPTIKTRKALLLIDLQNDFVSPAGNLTVPNTVDFVSKLPVLIEKFREEGLIVWSQTSNTAAVLTRTAPIITFVPNSRSTSVQTTSARSPRQGSTGSESANARPKTPENPEAFLSSTVPESSRCCLPSTSGAALPVVLSACIDTAQDLVVLKSEYSALSSFALSMQLRARMVTDLYVSGSLSNIGVYATVWDAVQQGFNVKLIEDCLGFRDPSLHMEAMKRMADDLCAEGIDYQELMDDLYGLLGDVIPNTQFTQAYEVSLSAKGSPAAQAGRSPSVSHAERVSKWMDEMNTRSSKLERPPKDTNRRHSSFLTSNADSQTCDSSQVIHKSRSSPRSTPPRKRSTSDRDSLVEPLQPTSTTNAAAADSETQTTADIPTSKKSRTQRSSKPEEPEEVHLHKYTSPTQFLAQSHSTSHVPSENTSHPTDPRSMSQPILPMEQPSTHPSRRKPKYKPTYVSNSEPIGDGDSYLVQDVLPPSQADTLFRRLKSDVAWQKMYHRTGAVPRLVASQGTITNGAIPIYRHPADEAPPLLPFDPTVQLLREHCEQIVGHPLNHVLIQHYRTGEDNISEHSDKTIDVVRGSSIVNLSLGAMRTMTLRTKKAATQLEQDDTQRQSQRIRLPHNSVFVLGQRTNANWLHSIRADKRPVVEKSEEEMAFGGERISLTFRHIGTFHDESSGLIWGQGATGKTREEARQTLTGAAAEKAKEEIIIGFGKENHLNEQEFDWEGTYGAGFDVVNYIVQENPT